MITGKTKDKHINGVLTFTTWQGWADDTRQVQNSPNFQEKCQHYWNVLLYWNHHRKCIQISKNMPSICLIVSHEIGFGISETSEKEKEKSIMHCETKMAAG